VGFAGAAERSKKAPPPRPSPKSGREKQCRSQHIRGLGFRAARDGHEHRDSQILRRPVGICPGDEGRGAALSEVPRAPLRAQPRRPDQGARRGGRPLVRDPWRQGRLARRAPSRAGHHARLQERDDRRLAADPADRLARPDQRPKGFQPHRRGAGGPHQLVGPDHDGDHDRRLAVRREAHRRHHALLQHDQWRTGVRLRQGRPDRAHDADRFRRHRSAALDRRGAGDEIHAAAQDNARAPRPERQVDRLFAGPPAPSDEAGRLRSRRRAQSGEPRQVRVCAHIMGRGARSRLLRDQAP
jgi:hypothetical protein